MSIFRFTFRQPRTRCIVPDTQGKDTRLLLLAASVKDPGDADVQRAGLGAPRTDVIELHA